MDKRCPKCKERYDNKRHRTNHHILPVRFFKSSGFQELCRECHNKIEEVIQKKEKRLGTLRPHEYFKIWYQFMEIKRR